MADNNVFNLAENDGDAHHPLIVHCTPSDTTYSEVQTYKDPESKKRKAQNRRERQYQNKMKGWQNEPKEEVEDDDAEWPGWNYFQNRSRWEGRQNYHQWSSSSSSYASHGGGTSHGGKGWRRK